jgi:hypothetical protein
MQSAKTLFVYFRIFFANKLIRWVIFKPFKTVARSSSFIRSKETGDDYIWSGAYPELNEALTLGSYWNKSYLMDMKKAYNY